MKEYKFLFKRIMLYLMRYGTEGNYYRLSKNIERCFSCDYELVLMVMRLYYGDDIDDLINKHGNLPWYQSEWTNSYVNHHSTIPSNLFNNCSQVTNFSQVFNIRIPDNIQMVNKIL